MTGSSDRADFPFVDLPHEAVSSSATVVAYLVGQLVRLGKLPPDQAPSMVAKILHRETLGSTAIGQGVAIPHCKSESVKKVEVLIGRSRDGCCWSNAADGKPVYVIVLIIAPAADALRALEDVARWLRGNLPGDRT